MATPSIMSKRTYSSKALDDIAAKMSDNEAAKQINEETYKRFKTIFEQK